MRRHPNLAEFEAPDLWETALMVATCKYVSTLDFSQGFGHTEQLKLERDGDAARSSSGRDEWGSTAAGAKGKTAHAQ